MQHTFRVGALLDAFRTPVGVFTPGPVKPAIVLVHGGFAAPWGWNGVVARLREDGYRAIAAVNPLRSLAGDAASIATIARCIPGDVILVGHAYGGLVVTEAAARCHNVKALVYVAAFIPEIGESALSLSLRFPGSTLADALQPAISPGEGVDLHVQPAKFHQQFAADVPESVAALMAATQHPITRAAMLGRSTTAAWRTLPSFSIYGSADRNIPVALQGYMSNRAKVMKPLEVSAGSHLLMLSHAERVASVIEDAATAVMSTSLAAA